MKKMKVSKEKEVVKETEAHEKFDSFPIATEDIMKNDKIAEKYSKKRKGKSVEDVESVENNSSKRALGMKKVSKILNLPL